MRRRLTLTFFHFPTSPLQFDCPICNIFAMQLVLLLLLLLSCRKVLSRITRHENNSQIFLSLAKFARSPAFARIRALDMAIKCWRLPFYSSICTLCFLLLIPPSPQPPSAPDPDSWPPLMLSGRLLFVHHPYNNLMIQ